MRKSAKVRSVAVEYFGEVAHDVQARNGSLFPSAAITLYVTYLGYSALQSEPHEYECNGVGHRITAASATTLALGMLLTLLSVVYSALRAGSNTQTFLTSSASGSPTAADVEEALLDKGTSAGLDGAPDSQTMSSGDAPCQACQLHDCIVLLGFHL